MKEDSEAQYKAGDCLSVSLDKGLYTAAIVLRVDQRPTVGTLRQIHLIGVLDYLSNKKPNKEVFEERKWLIIQRQYSDPRIDLIWYLMGQHSSNIDVVRKTEITHKDPTYNEDAYTWSQFLGKNVPYQKEWDQHQARHRYFFDQLDYHTILSTSIECLCFDINEPLSATDIYRVYLSIEDLIDTLKYCTKKEWRSLEAKSRGTVNEKVYNSIRALCEIVKDKFKTENTIKLLLRTSCYRNRSASKNEISFQKLFQSADELDKTYRHLRKHILSHYTLEEML